MSTVAVAQRQVAGTTVYPDLLYPGENIITITNDDGIEKIRFRSTSNTRVTVPPISGCPRQVNITVHVDDATTNESLDLTFHNCNGEFASTALRAENWTIKREYTGRVEIGKDTCVECEIQTTDPKTVDSIVVNNPRFSVRMPSGGPPWRAVASEFHYFVCYRPSREENFRETIKLYIRRSQPNGGLTHYVIEKPINAVGVPPPPPPKPDPRPIDTLPPLVDPTTFRNIVMPTAEALGQGRFFAGNYEVVGWLAGYGITDRATFLVGTAAVPKFISNLLVVTVGAKYEALSLGPLKVAVGYQYGFSSTDSSDITVSAPYGVVSYGDKRNRISLAGGYSWKHHKTKSESFDRNAAILALGGDMTIGRAWKLAAETYMIESSGLAPVAVTARWFQEHYALDFGLAVDLGGGNDVRGTGTFSGEIKDLRIAPIVSFIWKW